MKNLYKNKSLLITGGTGSFGRCFILYLLKNFNLSNLDRIKTLYKSYEIWEKFDLNFLTHCSADPQI